MRRDVPWDRIVAAMSAVSRHATDFCRRRQDGGRGGERGGPAGRLPDFAASGFFQRAVSIDTMNRRPLVNTRDEPHADASKYRRFHVIIGDANMSQWATALKLGTTALVLDLIERGKAPAARNRATDRGDEIDQPRSELRLDHRAARWAEDLGDRYPAALSGRGAEDRARSTRKRAWLLREWEDVLNDLERDVIADARSRGLGGEEISAQHVAGGGEAGNGAIRGCRRLISSITISIGAGLYYELLRQGSMRRVVNEDEIRRAIFSPPETTRAYFRGRAVARFTDQIESIQWNEIVLSDAGRSQRIALPEPADENLKRLNAAVRESATFADFLRALES